MAGIHHLECGLPASGACPITLSKPPPPLLYLLIPAGLGLTPPEFEESREAGQAVSHPS